MEDKLQSAVTTVGRVFNFFLDLAVVDDYDLG